MKRKPETPLTDRERILMLVIRGLETAAILCRRGDTYDEESWKRGPDWDGPYVHFVGYRKAVKGDLVMGKTGMRHGPHPYSIGFYVEPLIGGYGGYGGAVIREIGSPRLCNYSNEDFTPIVGLTKTELLEGTHYQVYLKVLRAFGKGGEYNYRFGGVDITDEELTIWVREAFGGISRPSKPFAVKLKWTKRTTVKAILAAMREQGYGTRQFDLDEVEHAKREAEKAARG